MDEKLFSKYFKAFGDPSRLRILAILISGEKTVNDIAKAVKLSQPTVSRHLAIPGKPESLPIDVISRGCITASTANRWKVAVPVFAIAWKSALPPVRNVKRNKKFFFLKHI